jgi:hypothetical protein
MGKTYSSGLDSSLAIEVLGLLAAQLVDGRALEASEFTKAGRGLQRQDE